MAINKKVFFIILLLAFIIGFSPDASFGADTSGRLTAGMEASRQEAPAPSATQGLKDQSISTAPSKPFYKPAPKLSPGDYPRVRGVNGRLMVWLAAQMHLWFAAFVLAVPIFVFIIEAIGMATKDERYDMTAYEFIRVSIIAYSVTAITGGLLVFSLLVFYPDFFRYLTSIFGPTMLAYALLFFVESAALYVHYYGWHAMKSGLSKWLHLTVGLILNAAGTALMFIANAWVTFMMSPSGVDPSGVFDGNIWHAVHNHLWNPMNLHRFVANIAYGASIVGAYAAYKFLSAHTPKDKAHYDWMGYTANFIAIGALMPLPFAGYWLTAEIYRYSQQMGITLMGGAFAWLFIIQAVLIGALFLAANYYLWCGMERSAGGRRYAKYVKYIAFVILISFLVWFTPHTLILRPSELRALGGQYHPFLGPLGVMPAKNIAVNIMIIFTYLSFLLYRRSGRTPVVSWVTAGNALQAALFAAGILNIIFLGVYYGYFTSSVYKVASSVPQVATTASVIIGSAVIESFMYRGAVSSGPFEWGRMPERSQYALLLVAVSFTWLMGLMGYVRSAIRQHWHVFSVMRDSSPEAYTPTIGYAAKVVSAGTVIFMAAVIFIFWLSTLSGENH